ncbi:Solute carrier family 25 member 40, partial [Zancudomyces culisetae]
MQDKRHLLGIRVGNGGGAGTCYATVAAMPQKVASDVGRQRITGTVSGFKMIAQNEGILRLWSGLGLGLTAGLPSTVVYFVGYDMLRNYVSTEVRKYPKLAATDPYVPLVTGCLARTLAVTLISPLELMRTQLQSSSSHNLTTVFRGVVASVRTNGLKSMYRGLGPTLLRDVPFSSIYWFSYERIKSSLLSNPAYNLFVSNLELGPGFVTSFVSGAVSGSIAAILTNPFDVAKTLYQSESSSQ